VEGLARGLRVLGADDARVARLLAGFTAWSPEFRTAISVRGGPPGFEAPAQESTS